MSAFKTILYKELKSMIRDPKIIIAMIISPFIIVGLMYGIMIFSTQQMVRETLYGKGTIIYIDNDHGYWARNFTSYLEKIGYKLVKTNSSEELFNKISDRRIVCGIIIPKGFSENITRNKTAYLKIYVYVHSPSMTSLMSKTKIFTIIDSFSENLTAISLTMHGLNPKYVMKPVNTSINILLRDKLVKVEDFESVIGSMILASIFIPLLVMILASFLVQLTSTSIAVEKEEKMFETILSLPINRFEFIAAKIVAAVLVGFLGLGLYGVLFLWYFSSIANISTSGSTSSPIFASISTVYSPSTIPLLIIALIGMILFILGLSIILALFVEDVRSAQMLTSYIVLPLVFMMIINMFLDISGYDPLTRHLLALIPLLNIGFLSTYMFIEDYVSIYITAFSSIIYALIIMYIASKLISTEKVFTLRLFRKKRKYST